MQYRLREKENIQWKMIKRFEYKKKYNDYQVLVLIGFIITADLAYIYYEA